MSKHTDWQALYPFESHRLSVDGGHQYHYVDEGPQSPGTGPLLMVHGNPTWSFYWRNLILATRDEYRAIAPDHIGCGLSDKPSDSAYPYLLQRRIDDLCHLIETLDLHNITLVAHDWGGAIGLGAAGRMPDRFARHILLNTGAFTGERCPWRIRICRWPLFGRIALQGFNAFSLAALRMAVERRESLPPAVRSGLIAPYDSWANRTAVYQFVRDIPITSRDRSYDCLQSVENGLENIKDRPTCLIWGMRDWCFTPHCLERFETLFPGSQSHRLEDAGHYVMEDATDRVIPIVREFLKSG